MPKYQYEVIDMQYGLVEVEAADETEAFLNAITAYENGKVNWIDSDVQFELQETKSESV